MSQKHSSRRKSKRTQDGGDADSSVEILRKIHSMESISDDDISQLYMLSKPVCQGCRVNSKHNPNCFCGLIPPPNGTRKSGLWQKISEFISSIGQDVCEDLRDQSSCPAGLTNLGATCYANSILQCLYMNMSFRRGVFSVEVDVLKNHPVLDQLVRLFAQLQGSKLAVIESAPFIKTLELDNSVQQDSHEFLTLFLSLLERSLSHSKVSRSRTIIQDIFCGSMSHVTRCSSCGKDSAASSGVEDFYDLELNINGLKKLDESLDDYFSVEELCGENQYFCDACHMHVNATRHIELRKLPNILIFQLKRCIFLPKTTTRKKITSLFSFPLELSMNCRIRESYQSEAMYDLSAVLMHKGMCANSGHYIAHIKDDLTSHWWEFDDEHVSKLEYNLLREESSKSLSKHGDESFMYTCTPESEYISSSDAYMLMYRRRDTDTGGTNVLAQSDGVAISVATHASPMEDTICVPPHLSTEINDQNSVYTEACEKYKLNKEKALDSLVSRRHEVQSVLYAAPVLSLEEPFFWIRTVWLSQWADSLSALPIDNTHIQCSHGKVSAEMIGSMKRLSSNAWTVLFSKYGGGPVLTKNDCCIDCLFASAKSLAFTDTYRDRRARMKELAKAALSGYCHDGPLYFVSRPWLQQWLKRKNIDGPCEADTSPTASIRCPHGDFVPEATGAKRVLVPEILWHFFCEDANMVSPDNSWGRLAFPLEKEPCARCSTELIDAAYHEDTLREMKMKQRQNHEKLAVGKPMSLSCNCRYYLLPSSWISKWRNFINSGAKSSSRPEILDHIINSLKCEKHSLLLQRPHDLILKRDMVLQSVSATDGLTLISENDWKLFCEEWNGTMEDGLSASIEISNGGNKDTLKACDGCSVHCGSEGFHPEAVHRVAFDDFDRMSIKTCPLICEDCIGEKESSVLISKLSYSQENIRVYFVRGNEAPNSILKSFKSAHELERRCSKRSRVENFGNSVVLTVCGSTTLYQLKMLIWESFAIVKENQVLHKGSRIIDGESATLADVGIFPGDTLWVTDSEIHDYRDIADEFTEQKMDQKRDEGGFCGTLLASSTSLVAAEDSPR